MSRSSRWDAQAAKLETHDGIVQIASKRIREAGLDGISIANLMKASERIVRKRMQPTIVGHMDDLAASRSRAVCKVELGQSLRSYSVALCIGAPVFEVLNERAQLGQDLTSIGVV